MNGLAGKIWNQRGKFKALFIYVAEENLKKKDAALEFSIPGNLDARKCRKVALQSGHGCLFSRG